jgi:hypothetical protein
MAKQKLKLPKSLAGLKIPKKVRRAGKRFMKRLNRTGRVELVAEALIATGTALMASRKARQAVAEAAQGLGHGQGRKEGGGVLAEALGGEKSKKDRKLRDKAYPISDPNQQRH